MTEASGLKAAFRGRIPKTAALTALVVGPVLTATNMGLAKTVIEHLEYSNGQIQNQ